MTMQDSVESSLYIKEMLHDVLSDERGVKLPTEHVTDNISLKNAIYSNSQVIDNRLRFGITQTGDRQRRDVSLMHFRRKDVG